MASEVKTHTFKGKGIMAWKIAEVLTKKSIETS
jgi:hypothetical protein